MATVPPAHPGAQRPAERCARDIRVFLASRSPRRRELLAEAGYTFDFDHPGIEDSELLPGAVSPAEWVASLAYLKTRAGLEVLRSTRRLAHVVLGADTACVLDGRMIGTPRDAAEAREMIRAFVNREHGVVTGVALLCAATGRRDLFADAASVTFGPLADGEIDAYVASERWRGKAGAYNLSERLAAGWPIEYRGDPSAIMGLPMNLLARRLPSFAALCPDLREQGR